MAFIETNVRRLRRVCRIQRRWPGHLVPGQRLVPEETAVAFIDNGSSRCVHKALVTPRHVAFCYSVSSESVWRHAERLLDPSEK